MSEIWRCEVCGEGIDVEGRTSWTCPHCDAEYKEGILVEPTYMEAPRSPYSVTAVDIHDSAVFQGLGVILAIIALVFQFWYLLPNSNWASGPVAILIAAALTCKLTYWQGKPNTFFKVFDLVVYCWIYVEYVSLFVLYMLSR